MAGRTESGLFHARPTVRISLAAGAVFLVLVALGSWQLQRLGWKQDRIDERQSRAAGEAVELSTALAEPGDFNFRPVRLNGQFLHEKELFLAARSFDRRVGWHVITPLALEGGGTVLVNRGWIPYDRQDAALRAEGQVAGVVRLNGLIRTQQPQATFQPDNEAEEGVWYWVEIDAMGTAIGLEVLPVVVEADATANPGGVPIGGQTRLEMPNDHLQYALTWYALALILAVIFVVFHRRKPATQEGSDPDIR
jgi:surfeit locus 1 family protein